MTAAQEIQTKPYTFDYYRELVSQGTEPERNSRAWYIREQLILQYHYLTKRLVLSMAKAMPTHVEREDLESLATLGLISAVRLYDNTIGVPFEAYAMQKMRSSVMDGVRKQDWAPRTLRRKQREIDRAEAQLKQKLDRSPTTDELADALEVEPNEIVDTKYQSEISHHTHLEYNYEALNTNNQPVDNLDLVNDLRAAAARTLRNMPVREATVLALRYYQDKKLHEVAEIMGLSTVKVGQLHKEAVLSFCVALEAVLAE